MRLQKLLMRCDSLFFLRGTAGELPRTMILTLYIFPASTRSNRVALSGYAAHSCAIIVPLLQILHCICLADPILPGFLPGHLAGDDPGYQQFPRFALGYVAGDAELFFCHEVRAGGQLLTAALKTA